MWARAEVNTSEQYQVALCQGEDGKRWLHLHKKGAAALPERAVLVTEIVPTDLLLRGDVLGIAETVKLNDGTPFFMDAHGTWLTKEECEAMDRNEKWTSIPWFNGLVPDFAER